MVDWIREIITIGFILSSLQKTDIWYNEIILDNI